MGRERERTEEGESGRKREGKKCQRSVKENGKRNSERNKGS
jgi:hypothetical protein